MVFIEKITFIEINNVFPCMIDHTFSVRILQRDHSRRKKCYAICDFFFLSMTMSYTRLNEMVFAVNLKSLILTYAFFYKKSLYNFISNKKKSVVEHYRKSYTDNNTILVKNPSKHGLPKIRCGHKHEYGV